MQHKLQRLLPSFKLLSISLFSLFALQVGLSVALRYYYVPEIVMSIAALGEHVVSQPTNSSIDTSWHTPLSSDINNLSSAINGSGVYGFIFNSSTLPPNVPYGQLLILHLLVKHQLTHARHL